MPAPAKIALHIQKNNFSLISYLFGHPQSINETIFNDARAQAGIYSNITPYEALNPLGLQAARAFSVIDAIANSALAGGTYLGATIAGANADTRDGLTLAAGQLAQIGASFVFPRASLSPVSNQTTKATGASPASAESPVPANSANAAVELRTDLARQSGIPTSTQDVWGSSLEQLQQAFNTGGATITQGQARASSSGNAQILNVEGSSTGVTKIQFSPASELSQHAGQYYKFTYADGSELKIIDPATYQVTGWPENKGRTTFVNSSGTVITFNPITRKWI